MRVRQFKIRINQSSFIKDFVKDWNSDWFTTNKTLCRSCLHAELQLFEINRRSSDRSNTQYGNLHISFLNNFIRLQYFSFTYLLNTLPLKDEVDYELWTLSMHYSTQKYYPLYTIKKNQYNSNFLMTNKLSYTNINYKQNKNIQTNLNKFHLHTRKVYYNINFFRAIYWNRWKNQNTKFKEVDFYFHNYERVELNRIVYNKARRFYFHPYYKYFYKEYITYLFTDFKLNNKFFIPKTLEVNKPRQFTTNNCSNIFLYTYRNSNQAKRVSNYNQRAQLHNKILELHEFRNLRKINILTISRFIKKAEYWLYYDRGYDFIKFYPFKTKFRKLHKYKIFHNIRLYKQTTITYEKNDYTIFLNLTKNYNIKYFYITQRYAKFTSKHIQFFWLNKPYWQPLMVKKFLRRYFVTSFFKFKVCLLVTLYKVWHYCYYQRLKAANIFKLDFPIFTQYYINVLYTYYYIKGFSQTTKKPIIMKLNVPYIYFDYNIKHKDSLLKNHILGFTFYKSIQLSRAKKNSHYLGSFDILLNVVQNINFSKYGASFIATFFNLQLQKIPNKKMQKWFLGACNEFLQSFILLNKNNKIKKLQFTNIQGIQLDFKGRAVDLRRVFVRRKKYGHTYNTGHGYYDVSKSYYFDFFVTKWGSTSIRVSYFFNNYYHNTVGRFISTGKRRYLFSNKYSYRKAVYNYIFIEFLYINTKLNYRNVFINNLARWDFLFKESYKNNVRGVFNSKQYNKSYLKDGYTIFYTKKGTKVKKPSILKKLQWTSYGRHKPYSHELNIV